jgi:hypothetical protein
MRSLFLLLALAVTLPAQAFADPPERQPLTIANASPRIAECAVVVDGHTRTMLKLHPGKAWTDSFRPGQDLRLVCERSRKLFFGPLKAGESYRLVGEDRWLELAEGAAQ